MGKKKILGSILLMFLLLFAVGLAEEPWDISNNVYVEGEIEMTPEQQQAQNPIFEIKLANGKILKGELYPETAPESVGNFIALANSGYYDGLTFHRVIPGFMIQGGCPTGTGTGGPGWHIKGEFLANGVENPIKHTYGILSMARTMVNDSAGSQFFLMTSDSPHLNGSYAAFGKVLEGMEAADEVVNTQRDHNDKPLEEQIMESIRVETFGKEYSFTKLP